MKDFVTEHGEAHYNVYSINYVHLKIYLHTEIGGIYIRRVTGSLADVGGSLHESKIVGMCVYSDKECYLRIKKPGGKYVVVYCEYETITDDELVEVLL